MWLLKDLKNNPNGPKVMSIFSGGGGSSMGYKLAGYNVIACNDIDKKMMYHYEKNLNPRFKFLMPAKKLTEIELPEDCFNLDVLDGSPPCSTFSTAGLRSKTWGEKKHFREGQEKQLLSELFFDFIDLAAYLKPKVVIAENVKGILLGKAKGYVKLITNEFKNAGYKVQVFLIDSSLCNVPQKRERVFFCCIRSDIFRKKLKLIPSGNIIKALDALKDLPPQKTKHILSPETYTRWASTKPGESFSKSRKRLTGQENSHFNRVRAHPFKPAPTLTTTNSIFHWSEPRHLTFPEYKRLGTFADDYCATSENMGKYIVGMSVPPKMIEYIATEVREQWLDPIRSEPHSKPT